MNIQMYNNISYKNNAGFQHSTPAWYMDNQNIYRNNISYDNTTSNWVAPNEYHVADHNTWDSSVTVSDADFISLDVSELYAPRKSDNSLPDVSFGHLVTGSDLIYAGTDVGLTIDGDGDLWNNPPSMGAYEYDGSDGAIAPTVTTTDASYIGLYEANSGGNVTSDGSSAIIAAGVCCSTNSSPLVTDLSTLDSSTTGAFGSTLTGLEASTLYYVRAYAQNAIGTSYGTDVSFYTLPEHDGSVYYVATDGSDNYEGTITQPWASWEKVFHSAEASTLVYFRGGTYQTTVTNGDGVIYNPSIGSGHYGTSDNWINFYNYPGETPILDCSTSRADNIWNFGIKLSYLRYTHIKGLHLKSVIQKDTSTNGVYDMCQGIVSEWCDNLILDQIVLYDIWGEGYETKLAIHQELRNCDAYDCCDYYHASYPGNWGSGFSTSDSLENYHDGYTLYYGCRAWRCSDQGYAGGGNKNHMKWENCWSFDNGNLTGGGQGWKFGYWLQQSEAELVVELANCIAARNYESGYTSNENAQSFAVPTHVYNCVAYDTSIFGFRISDSSDGEAQELKRIYKNNISYGSGVSAINVGGSYTHSNNSWDPSTGVTVSDEDFISLDVSELYAPRKSDGSLPDVSFGHLVTGSDLIYAGTWVDVITDGDGDPWNNPPSLGAYEYDGSSGDSSIAGGYFVESEDGKLITVSGYYIKIL